MITLTKVAEASEMAVAVVLAAPCGSVAWSGLPTRRGFPVSERSLRDVLSAPIMINNERILANLASTALSMSSGSRIRAGLIGAAALMTSSQLPGAGQTDLLERVGAAIFHNLGVDGVYARTGMYEQVIAGLGAYISAQRDPRAEILHFPPVMSRAQLEKSGYLKSFPNLLGCVCALHGTESEIRAAADSHDHGGDWTKSLAAADLVLSPAACYPLYPLARHTAVHAA